MATTAAAPPLLPLFYPALQACHLGLVERITASSRHLAASRRLIGPRPLPLCLVLLVGLLKILANLVQRFVLQRSNEVG